MKDILLMGKHGCYTKFEMSYTVTLGIVHGKGGHMMKVVKITNSLPHTLPSGCWLQRGSAGARSRVFTFFFILFMLSTRYVLGAYFLFI